jgi:ABC-2 type transport system permease protein/sodium transport system permease protein
VRVVADADTVRTLVNDGAAHVGVLLPDGPPNAESLGTVAVTVLLDQTEIRSQIAASGLEAIFDRAAEYLLLQRLQLKALDVDFVRPLEVQEQLTAPPEKVGGSILGQIVPLILIVMTITGAIYPAIDLTAGERERGTLETLMAAPVPTVDLIAGKFIVVALIGMISASLNLLSIGGTIYLGGLGDLLTRGESVEIPLASLPWVLLVLVPLAIMFSAILLAVCSFARSFKEAQNYVMPVMVAALIPAVIGVLPGTRLDGPMLIMPVTNIVILTRDLFTGTTELDDILWVTLSTTLYAGTAVAVAARLFGQEAVLFADSGSVKTLFQRRFFRPAAYPTAAQAFLVLAVAFSVNFFAQSALGRSDLLGTPGYWLGWVAIMIAVFVLVPTGVASYTKTRLRSAFSLAPPPAVGWLAALCLGGSTWVLSRAWFAVQSQWLPLNEDIAAELERFALLVRGLPPLGAVLLLGLVPAVCEELFFRGYALSGIRTTLGKWVGVAVVALAFGLFHHSIHRLAVTVMLGLVLGLTVVQFRSIWPAMLAHALHNAISLLSVRSDVLQPWLERAGFPADATALPPPAWLGGAAVLTLAGLLLCLRTRSAPPALEEEAEICDDGGVGEPAPDKLG